MFLFFLVFFYRFLFFLHFLFFCFFVFRHRTNVLVASFRTKRWSHRSRARVSFKSAEGEASGAGGGVLESLDLADRSSDKGTRKSQGLSLSACAGAWTLLAATPRRVASVTVTWAGRIEKAAQRAREVCACVLGQARSRWRGDCF